LLIQSSNPPPNPPVLRLNSRVKRLGTPVRSIIGERLIRQSASQCLTRTVVPESFSPSAFPLTIVRQPETHSRPRTEPGEIDPLYLLGCHALWEQNDDASAAWEVVSAAHSQHEETRAHARSLLANSQRIIAGRRQPAVSEFERPTSHGATTMKTPYGLEIISSCLGCPLRRTGFVCDLPPHVVGSLDLYAQHNVLPAGAQLFVEGQESRGVYFICSGRVKLATASREGKTLLLRMAEAGSAVGLSAAVAGSKYQMTAETATPCQVVFIESRALQSFMRKHPEAGVRMAQVLSENFQSAYREIHDLVLTRSSEGKLVRLLLAAAPDYTRSAPEVRLQAPMTHEEMAQRIGSSRETVTRLLSNLKKRQLLRQEGSTLVIMNRHEFESLAM
jgi:CRP/FNR family transcriptional regulator, cyclic AMP receptor protein